MRVLIACEFSGVVRDAFLARGHDAWSCDLLPTERPGPHVEGDVRDVLGEGWDLMVAHPPCTYLTRAGARWWNERRAEQEQALDFVRALLASPIPRIALENPPGAIGTRIRKADQYIHPYMFGHPEYKHTGLWLVNLPLLVSTNNVKDEADQMPLKESKRTWYAAPGPDRWKVRSRTLPGIAAAMASQWA